MNGRNRTVSGKNRLSDRDMLFDLFVNGKYMSLFYDQALMNSIGSRVRNTIEELQQSEHKLAESITAVLQQRGWHGDQLPRQRPINAELSLRQQEVREAGRNRISVTPGSDRMIGNLPSRRYSSSSRRSAPAKTEMSNLRLD
jgi:hypothetical protein